jgi:phospholipid/cholesterol/gamma-HCH transport system substrate-binding protein
VKRKKFESFKELDQARLGLVGVVITALILAVALNVSRLQSVFEDTAYSADFAESGGLLPGDDVRVSGLKVGQVKSVELDGSQVAVTFVASNLTLGNQSSAAIKSANALGRKYLAITPDGDGRTTRIPRSRTNSGYSVSAALGDLATTTGELDTARIAQSISSLSAVLDQTPTEFRSALSGVSALSRTISSRDQALGKLLAKASGVSGVLADRNREIAAIMSNGSLLFQELDARRQAVSELLTSISSAADQLAGFVADNKKTFGPALTELRQVARLLHDYRSTLEYSVENLASYASGLGEAVGSGPFFQAYVENLTEPQSLFPGIGTLGGKS